MFDHQALQPMLLNNGKVDTTTRASNNIYANEYGHRIAITDGNLPVSVKWSYTKVVPTRVSHTKLIKSHFYGGRHGQFYVCKKVKKKWVYRQLAVMHLTASRYLVETTK